MLKIEPGHDLRYAIDASKINKELGWDHPLPLKNDWPKPFDWYIGQ